MIDETTGQLQKNTDAINHLQETVDGLKGLVDTLCDNLSDYPAGCDACWLQNEDGTCQKDEIYKKFGL